MADNSLEIRTRVRMAQWQSIIKECKESGMAVAEFCEDRNISWHAYYYWLRKIKDYITQPQSSETEFVQLPSPVEVPSPANPGTITIRIGGVAVEVEGHVNRASLKNVLKVLQEM
ncbi:hypothetical protein [uncultured Anaerovibrio sp.]|uniref:IS66 family insertion sequence element accessory protein TnpA n=1 Tax=uncultured Anaerovibrio sp. TaxID=361586 RepID=UPI0025F1F196|nr:hypothetical protein [uncultured Anaerovibrio sp.]